MIEVIATAQLIKNRTVWTPTFKMFGFWMNPVLKLSDFGSLLYLLLGIPRLGFLWSSDTIDVPKCKQIDIKKTVKK